MTGIFIDKAYLPSLLSRQKGGQICNDGIGSRVFKRFCAALSVLGLPFSNSKNAQYGLIEAAAIIAAMCENNRYFRGATAYLQNEMRCPQADWLLRLIKTIDPDSMSEICDKMLSRSLKSALKFVEIYNIGPVTIAIDKHLIPRYDKPADMRHNMTKGKSERGTCTFETYMTVDIVAGFTRFNLACCKVDRGHFDDEFVRKIVQKCMRMGIPVRMVLLDREFYSVAVMKTLRMFGQNFIMPAVQNKGTNRAIKEHQEGKRGAVSEYTMKSPDGNKFTFNLVIVYNEEDEKYYTFATNVMCQDPSDMLEHVTEEYKHRWGIETAYRCLEQMRPHTTSKNASVRIMLFYMTLIMYNIWMHEREKMAPGVLTLDLMLGYLMKLVRSLDEMQWACDPGGG